MFYNDRASFQTLIQMMRSERDRMDENSPLMYHIHLVELLAVCTEGKNVYTEIKCNSLLPLDDIVRVVTHEDCIPEVSSLWGPAETWWLAWEALGFETLQLMVQKGLASLGQCFSWILILCEEKKRNEASESLLPPKGWDKSLRVWGTNSPHKRIQYK